MMKGLSCKPLQLLYEQAAERHRDALQSSEYRCPFCSLAMAAKDRYRDKEPCELCWHASAAGFITHLIVTTPLSCLITGKLARYSIHRGRVEMGYKVFAEVMYGDKQVTVEGMVHPSSPEGLYIEDVKFLCPEPLRSELEEAFDNDLRFADDVFDAISQADAHPYWEEGV